MSKTIKIKNNDTVAHIWCGQTVQPSEYYQIQALEETAWANDVTLLVDIANEIAIVNDGSQDIIDINLAIQYLKNLTPALTKTTGEIVCPWACIKNFFNNASGSTMQYFEQPYEYYIWLEYRLQKLFVPSLVKGTDDCNEFEADYKHLCNLPEAPKVRITTCKVGRKLHDRYASFTTSDQDQFDNTDFNHADYGDITYKMYKWVDDERVLTTNGAEADETWIDFEPSWDYEIASGAVDVPTALPGEDLNKWEIHVIAAPDIPKIYGGTVELISNPRLKFKQGTNVGVDSSLHPAEMLYSATHHANKIRFIIMHPVGAQAEFQLNLKLYK